MAPIDPNTRIFWNASTTSNTINTNGSGPDLITSVGSKIYLTTSGGSSWALGPYDLPATYQRSSSWDMALHKSTLKDHVDAVTEELKQINLRYNILDPTFKKCEVLASKMLFNLLPKRLGEFGCSTVISGRRNIFVIVKTYDENADIIETVVDVCAAQHGGVTIQLCTDNLAAPWIAEFRYKSAASLVKRLAKEGWPLKELSLKDAIALSARYTISGISPSQMDLHLVNPTDADGRKFLEKFGKEVGFKTTLAQLLLDSDPIVAEKAQVIAQIILQR